jgi:O-antigen/teichoic acid export membrane protein
LSLESDTSASSPPEWFLTQRLTAPLARAAGKLGWPLVNQAVISGGNFLTLVTIARALRREGDYGVFGLVLELMFYLNAIPAALVTYPLTVRGATGDDEQVRRMTMASLLLTAALAAPVVLAGALLAVFSHRAAFGFAACFALVAWQLQEVARRALTARFRYAGSTCGDTVRYVGPAVALWAMSRYAAPSLTVVFVVIGACALLALGIQTIQVRPAAIGWREMARLPRESWSAGRWMLLTSVIALLTSLLTVWTLTWRYGTGEVGQFYAIANFTKPLNPLVLTFSGLLMQYVAKHYAHGGIRRARSTAIRLSALTLAITLPLLAVLVLFPGWSLRLLYGKATHFAGRESELLLQLFAASFVVSILMSLCSAFLSGLEQTRSNFIAQIAGSLGVVVLAFPLTLRFGLMGMLIGGTIAATVQLMLMIWFTIRVQRHRPDQPSSEG